MCGRASRQNFEELLKDLKEAREKASPPVTVLVSQAVVGQEGTVYYLTNLQSSIAGFDGMPSMQKMLGDEGLRQIFEDECRDGVEHGNGDQSLFARTKQCARGNRGSGAGLLERPKPQCR